MRRIVCLLVILLVMVLMGRPALGQVQTVRQAWADSVVGTWIGKSDPEVLVLRSDSTALMGGHRMMALDTFAWFTKDHWSVTESNTNSMSLWVGREKQDPRDNSGRAWVWRENSGIIMNFKGHRYKRVDSAVSLVNRLHPRPVPAPTGMLAQLLGTWEQQDSVSKDGRVAISRSTIRADSTVVKTVLWMQGADTVSSEAHLETVIVSGDTLWWGGWFDPNAEPRRIGRGRTVVVQDDQLTLFKVETPTVPDQVYKRVTSSIQP